MVQRRQQLRLALEPRQAIGIGRKRLGEDLEGDLAIEPAVPRAIHLAPMPPAPIWAVTS
jgi:hypothetical protein